MRWHHLNPLWYQTKAVELLLENVIPTDPFRYLYVTGLFFGITLCFGIVTGYYFTMSLHWIWSIPFVMFTAFIVYGILVVWRRATQASQNASKSETTDNNSTDSDQ